MIDADELDVLNVYSRRALVDVLNQAHILFRKHGPPVSLQ